MTIPFITTTAMFLLFVSNMPTDIAGTSKEIYIMENNEKMYCKACS